MIWQKKCRRSKKTFKDSNDNELRQVVDLGDGKIQIQFETTESTVGDVSLTDAGGNMGTTSTPSVSTDTIFTTRDYMLLRNLAHLLTQMQLQRNVRF